MPFVRVLVPTGDAHPPPFSATVSALFTDVVSCLGTPLLEIKKSCVDSVWDLLRRTDPQPPVFSGLSVPRQLRTVKTRTDPPGYSEFLAGTGISSHLKASYRQSSQDCNDRNPLIRALAIRTMSYISIPVVTEAMTEQLRHCLKDKDPYVRKTAAICVAKLYATDPRKAERGGFVETLRDLLVDPNATVVSNAVAALSEIGDRQDGVTFKLNFHIANKLLTALGESSEYVLCTCNRAH